MAHSRLTQPTQLISKPSSSSRAASGARKDPISFLDDIEDDDLLSMVESSPYFTQATQVVAGPPVLKRQPPPTAARRSSSPLRIEVPASSPLSAKKLPYAPPRAGRLANMMAPAGTSYRAPPRPPAPKKIEHIAIPDSDDELTRPRYEDSSDDGEPARGTIQPTSFKRKEPPPATSSNVTSPVKPHSPARGNYHKLAENRVEAAAKKLLDKVKRRYTLAECRAALLECGLDMGEAESFLFEHTSLSQRSSQSSAVSSKSSQSSAPSIKMAGNAILLSSDNEAEHSPAPPPKRRRLMQGRRRRSSLQSSPLKLSQSKPEPVSQVIDLTTDDEEFQGDPLSPSPDTNDEFDDRMLNYLNNCDKVQLMAIANIKEANAEAMLKHQPFLTLNSARDVTIPHKKGGRMTQLALGEQIVDAIQEYASALDGIDHVIAACDRKAATIRAATSAWKVDVTGTNRAEAVGEHGQPMTPESISGGGNLVDLPISKEPSQMQGNCTMKPYQLYGLNWMYLLYERGFGGILADDMGLGKTCQVISLMCAIVDNFDKRGAAHGDRPWPNLVVVPPSTLANWEAEFQKFAPDMRVISYCGPQAERDDIAEAILESPDDYHVILTTYTQLGRPADIDNLRQIRPIVAVFDEGHKMKNPKTKIYRDLIRIPATWRLLLTGTPVQNNIMEMIALLQFVEPSLFQDHFEDLEALFNQKVSLADVSKGALLFSERVARARTILEPFILQRRKEQVLRSLPVKTSRVVYCDLDKNQHDLYKGFERQFRKADAPQAKPKGRNNDNNNVWMQLRKSAIHPQLFRRAFDDATVAKMAKTLIRSVPQDELRQDNLEHLTNELMACSDFELHLWCRDYKCIRALDLPDKSWTDCAKVQKMIELVRGYKENGDRALIFTRFAKVIEILAESLASEGIAHLALQGNTDVGERQDLINQFTEDSDITVFLLTTGAGGTGINLVAANKVIIFDQSDNPQDDLQAENRAHRLGQTRDVEIVKLVSRDTIEELVQKACEKKLELANKVVGWEGGDPSMTSAEMEASIRRELMAKDSSPESTGSPEPAEGEPGHTSRRKRAN
ncbi:hypothetical protein GQ53DRAFT_751347 [Thozetella sp. PMI_491]|nr:hypothetical protein GQ53DRAFT_751347 [Thozetella sp. PMI_491]